VRDQVVEIDKTEWSHFLVAEKNIVSLFRKGVAVASSSVLLVLSGCVAQSELLTKSPAYTKYFNAGSVDLYNCVNQHIPSISTTYSAPGGQFNMTQSGPTIHLTYSIWLGPHWDLEFTSTGNNSTTYQFRTRNPLGTNQGGVLGGEDIQNLVSTCGSSLEPRTPLSASSVTPASIQPTVPGAPPPTTTQQTQPPASLDDAKAKCADLGFKAGTEKFGECVIKLSR